MEDEWRKAPYPMRGNAEASIRDDTIDRVSTRIGAMFGQPMIADRAQIDVAPTPFQSRDDQDHRHNDADAHPAHLISSLLAAMKRSAAS
jgi:hypothetical protein